MLRLLTAGSIEEQICRAAADKRALADRCITGGFFDGKTGAQKRQAYLLSLIRPTEPSSDRCHAANSISSMDRSHHLERLPNAPYKDLSGVRLFDLTHDLG